MILCLWPHEREAANEVDGEEKQKQFSERKNLPKKRVKITSSRALVSEFPCINFVSVRLTRAERRAS